MIDVTSLGRWHCFRSSKIDNCKCHIKVCSLSVLFHSLSSEIIFFANLLSYFSCMTVCEYVFVWWFRLNVDQRVMIKIKTGKNIEFIKQMEYMWYSNKQTLSNNSVSNFNVIHETKTDLQTAYVVQTCPVTVTTSWCCMLFLALDTPLLQLQVYSAHGLLEEL